MSSHIDALHMLCCLLILFTFCYYNLQEYYDTIIEEKKAGKTEKIWKLGQVFFLQH